MVLRGATRHSRSVYLCRGCHSVPLSRSTHLHELVGARSVATSHLDKLHNKQQYLPLPPWFKDNPLGAPAKAPVEEEARRIVTPLAGMPAGSCMINWTGA